MAYWHEDATWVGRIMVPSPDDCFWACIRIMDQRVSPRRCELYFLRRRSGAPGRLPDADPRDWLELWPKEPMIFDQLDEAKTAARGAIQEYEQGGFAWDRLTDQPYSPLRWEQLEEIHHQNLRSMAVVGKRSDGLFEVRYFEYEQMWDPEPGLPNRYRDDEWDWGRVRSNTLTLADDLNDARTIAREELEVVTASAHTAPIASRISV